MADANTYDNPWMKSKIGTNDENDCRCKVQLFSAPSATKALRGAAKKPCAHAAAATIGPNCAHERRLATTCLACTSGGFHRASLARNASSPALTSSVALAASSCGGAR